MAKRYAAHGREILPKKNSGFYRPKNCGRAFCEYYGVFGCRLKPDMKLENPIVDWKTCLYFKQRKFESSQKSDYYDAIYGRIAVYKDSHSAVWKGRQEG